MLAARGAHDDLMTLDFSQCRFGCPRALIRLASSLKIEGGQHGRGKTINSDILHDCYDNYF
jgi:hypothetical protein